MKDEKKRIKRLAEKIVQLEKQAREGKNEQEVMSKIQNITDSLLIEDMLEIDEYIFTKKLLTK